jgi:hypothetical protein
MFGMLISAAGPDVWYVGVHWVRAHLRESGCARLRSWGQ